MGEKDIRFQVVDHSAILDRLLDEVPQMVDKLKQSKADKNPAEQFSQQLLEKVIQESMTGESSN